MHGETYTLLDDCRHYVGKGGKLEKVTQLHAGFEQLPNTLLVQVVNHSEAFEAISHELGHVVVEVFINEFEVLLNVTAKLFDIVKNFPKKERLVS